MKKIFQYSFLAIFLIIILSYSYIKYNAASNGNQAPDFETTLVDGSSFKLSDLRGKYVLLDFWGSWCPPCLKEIPELVELHQKYPENIVIVTIALEKNDKTWKKVADKAGFTWKHQIANQNRFVLMSSIARKYGVSEIPSKFLISPEGKLIGKLSFKEIDKLLTKL